ncbi:hypothetical protein GGF32_002261 [Allomyces javanicus]|nr:hypothetical protein GGF32_002261 [Allomyces javanicus]
MANVLRTSTAVSFTPTDAVLIVSWNGDSYGDANLQLNLRKDAATGAITNSGITVVSAPRYPLCAPPKGVPLPSPPTVMQRSGDVAVVGPAGKVQHAETACATALGADYAPAILSGSRADEFKKASTLAFNAAGANKQVWIAGWEEMANAPLVLATGSAAGVGSVVEPEDIHGNKLYLCTLVNTGIPCANVGSSTSAAFMSSWHARARMRDVAGDEHPGEEQCGKHAGGGHVPLA